MLVITRLLSFVKGGFCGDFDGVIMMMMVMAMVRMTFVKSPVDPQGYETYFNEKGG